MGLWSFLDAVLAPAADAGATEVFGDSSAMSSTDFTTGPDLNNPEWHNGFGTMADYQVPAESSSLFSSSDWSSLDTGGAWTSTSSTEW